MNTASRRRPAAILVLLSGLAAGCASGSPEEFDRRMATYVGRPEADLVAGLGVPNRTYEAEGRRLLQYDLARPAPGPAITPSIGLGFGNFGWGGGWGIGTGLGLGLGSYGRAPLVCAVVFETRDGQVLGYDRRGDGCVA